MDPQPISVRQTGTPEEAEIVVAWLRDRGIKAFVLNPGDAGSQFFGATGHEGIAVCVADAGAAEQARELLRRHDEEVAAEHAQHEAGTIKVTCESCGTELTFEADTAGTVQQCTECGAYVDVPEGVT